MIFPSFVCNLRAERLKTIPLDGSIYVFNKYMYLRLGNIVASQGSPKLFHAEVPPQPLALASALRPPL